MSDFKNKLKECRKTKKLTLIDLAEQLKTSHATINRYELGVNEPSLDRLIELARLFNVSTDYLLGVEHKEEKVVPEFNPEQLQVVELIKKLNSKQLDKVYNYLLGLIDAAN